MLSSKTIATVKATAPILKEGGEVLTKHFYERMFKHNPEVLPLFNSTNQAKGTQQKALANAIYAYAANIDNLAALGDAVELIAQKHTAFRILPEHYPIVGENLLESIKEVLGDAASDEIIEAWAEAYFFLADILINREKQIYEEQESAPGGWKDFKKFQVIKKVKESDVITSFYLKPEDGSTLPEFKPGQYITVRVPSPCGHTAMRNYSLSDKPNQEHFRISIKRENSSDSISPKGYVSNMLHDSIEEGQQLEIAPPCGNFFLDSRSRTDRPLVLLAAGVGVTPILSILLSAIEMTPERKIIFIHASLHEKNQAFQKTIGDLAEKHSNLTHHYRYSHSQPEGVIRSTESHVSEGFVDIKLIESLVSHPNADFYFCGPKPFMTNIHSELLKWGTPATQIHFEFFGPSQDIE